MLTGCDSFEGQVDAIVAACIAALAKSFDDHAVGFGIRAWLRADGDKCDADHYTSVLNENPRLCEVFNAWPTLSTLREHLDRVPMYMIGLLQEVIDISHMSEGYMHADLRVAVQYVCNHAAFIFELVKEPLRAVDVDQSVRASKWVGVWEKLLVHCSTITIAEIDGATRELALQHTFNAMRHYLLMQYIDCNNFSKEEPAFLRNKSQQSLAHPCVHMTLRREETEHADKHQAALQELSEIVKVAMEKHRKLLQRR